MCSKLSNAFYSLLPVLYSCYEERYRFGSHGRSEFRREKTRMVENLHFYIFYAITDSNISFQNTILIGTKDQSKIGIMASHPKKNLQKMLSTLNVQRRPGTFAFVSSEDSSLKCVAHGTCCDHGRRRNHIGCASRTRSLSEIR